MKYSTCTTPLLNFFTYGVNSSYVTFVFKDMLTLNFICKKSIIIVTFAKRLEKLVIHQYTEKSLKLIFEKIYALKWKKSQLALPCATGIFISRTVGRLFYLYLFSIYNQWQQSAAALFDRITDVVVLTRLLCKNLSHNLRQDLYPILLVLYILKMLFHISMVVL